MKSNELFKPVVISFVAAALLYFVLYSVIEHRRVYRGPWQVTFTNDAAGAPVLLIQQPALGISNVQLVFPEEAAASSTNILFAEPRPVPFEVSFGKCVFMDTTFLPGTLAFELFGHEIQLIPRALTIDHFERPWQSNLRIPVLRTNLPTAAQTNAPSGE